MNKTLSFVGVPLGNTDIIKKQIVLKKSSLSHFFRSLHTTIFLLFFTTLSVFGEGSIDFINYNGYRLFYSANVPQQIKVYAAEGEFINVGASHVGITGGFIEVFRPDGTLHSVFDNTTNNSGLAIINNDIEEKNGPTGGGTAMGLGYIPGVVPVESNEAGIWTVRFLFPDPTILVFNNIMNDEPWIREEDQPTVRRGILAWDVTVSQNAAGNEGGNLLTGRVYSNEYASVISRNGNTSSPQYCVLTKDGFQYRVRFEDADPWNFPLFSNSFGLLKSDGQPVYASQTVQDITRTSNTNNWFPNNFYLYEPQAEDVGSFVNNKIFFNPPDANMPASAMTTDIYRQNTHSTWLYNTPPEIELLVSDFAFTGENSADAIPCPPSTMEQDGSAYIAFSSSMGGTAVLLLDLNGNGQFEDEEDRTIYQLIGEGMDTIRWDGLDGMGSVLPLMDGFVLNYQLKIRGGEMHVLMADVENNIGGVTFELLNEPAGTVHNNQFYYDHSPIGGAVSGGGEPGKPLPTTIPFTYANNFGNEKMLDYWTFLEYNSFGMGTFSINVISECEPPEVADFDGDGIGDLEDLDDDNDGVPDRMEFCRFSNDFSCLSNGLDPSGDADEDGILNYMDVDNGTELASCLDADGDGICDELLPEFDLDQDGVPNHFDLDSDHDGISDLHEAGHGQADLDGNGIIDGEAEAFGLNGFFNLIASHPDSLNAVATYVPRDKDGDSYVDHRDLDSDNDGINDVEEAGFGVVDMNNDGRIDLENGVGEQGLPALIDPALTNNPMPLPFDTDGDNVPDWHDLDSDNDGLHDVAEAGYSDIDNNGIIGLGILTVNFDGQALVDISGNALQTTSMPPNSDTDLLADYKDLDSDNDGINDVAEIGFSDLDDDGILGEGQAMVNEDGQITNDPMSETFLSISNPKDQDNDTYPDFRDLDSDNDGINDVAEASLGDPDNNGLIGVGNPIVNDEGQAVLDITIMVLMTISNPTDTDLDGVPDYNDLDTDNDGIMDVKEAGFDDLDDDGIIGVGVPEVNENGQAELDAIDNGLNTTSEPDDTDFDTVPNFRDLDSDNDAINDVAEGANPDPDNDGILGEGTLIVNTYGIATSDENETSFMITSNPKDKDADGVADFLDLDSDNDGINDVIEGGHPDGDDDGFVGIGAPTVNEQGQAMGDDNGVAFSTSSFPPDTDGDNIPDYNDLDTDNDAINDVVEGGNEDADNDGIIGTGQPLVNGLGQPMVDGEGNLISTTSSPTDTDTDETPDFRDLDSDGDGISDVVEGGHLDPDNNDMVGTGIPEVNENGQATGENAPTSSPTETDGDGDFDFQELDSDNDGILDEDECPSDAPCVDGDNDGDFDFQDIDRDNDGILDEFECPTGAPCVDTDGDGDPDVDDLDSDDDTLSDMEECPNGFPCPDGDSDSIPDFQEPDCVASGSQPVITNINSSGPTCSGEPLVLSADSESSESGMVTYTWTGPNDFSFTGTAPSEGPFSVTIENVDVEQQGSYTLTLRSQIGCESVPASIVVDVNPQPDTPILTANASAVCPEEVIELFATGYPGEVTYSWYIGNEFENALIETTTEPSLIITETNANFSGTYFVIANVDGCVSNPSNLVFIQVFAAGMSLQAENSSNILDPACGGSTVELSIPILPGATYQWIGPNGYTSDQPNAIIENVTAANAGEYFALVSENGCPPVASIPTQVFVVETVEPIITGGGSFCESSEVMLALVNDLNIPAGSTAIYQWVNADTNVPLADANTPELIFEDIELDQSGNYYLSVMVNDCPVEISNTVSIEVNTTPDEQAIVIEEAMSMCEDEEILIEAIAPNSATGRWSTLSGATIISPNDAETVVFDLDAGENMFIWTLTDANCGEFSSDTLKVVNHSTNIGAAEDLINGDILETITYNLLDNDNISEMLEGFTINIINAPNEGELEVDENGLMTYTPDAGFFGTVSFDYEICSASCPNICDQANVQIGIGETLFSGQCFIPNVFTPNEDNLNDAFSVNCLETDHPNNRLIIFNRWGDVVFEKESYQNDWKGTYQNQLLPPGTYFYVLYLDRDKDEALRGFVTLVR